jgi:hypothetical protein
MTPDKANFLSREIRLPILFSKPVRLPKDKLSQQRLPNHGCGYVAALIVRTPA